MSARDNGGPAFPEAGLSGLPNGEFVYGQPGMTLRDYFAAKAMQAEMITTFSDATPESAEEFAAAAARAGRSVEDHLAFNAYLIADAMLRARGGAA